MTNTRTINLKSIEVEDIYSWDFPDFCDAFVSYAEWNDGTPLTEQEMEELNVNELIFDNQLWLQA